MRKIFEEYAVIIVVTIVIVALIATIIMVAPGDGTGWMEKSLHSLTTGFSDKVDSAQPGQGGSGGASQLGTPSISITGSVLTITPVANATEYEIYNGDELLVTTSETTVDLATYLIAPGSYIVRVIAKADGYKASGESTVEYMKQLSPGLYQTGTNYTTLIKSWNALISEGIITDNGKIVSGQEGSLAGDLYISNEITEIVSSSYRMCANLTGVIIPHGVTAIKTQAFLGCTNLASAIIPNSVTALEKWAFSRCGFASIGPVGSGSSIEIPESVTSIGDAVFDYGSNLQKVVIPNHITAVTAQMFEYCPALTSIGPIGSGASVEIGGQVTIINKDAFVGCSQISSVVLPPNITTINDATFRYCTSLVDVTLHDKIKSIGTSAFNGCTALENITIPSSVTSLGQMCFYKCSNLQNITFEGTKEQWGTVSKAYKWNANTQVTTVVCSDGEVTL